MKRIVIFGATSAIAQAVARQYAQQRSSFYLIGRNEDKLNQVAADLQIRGGEKIGQAIWHAQQMDAIQATLQKAHDFLSGFDLVLIAYGILPSQVDCERNVNKTIDVIQLNTTSVIAVLTALSPFLIAQQAGTIAVLSSVAGDRGRRSHYLYGATKAALNTYLQGLRLYLSPHHVHVLTIKPGLVISPMTAHMPITPLFATPEGVAQDIVRAIEKKRAQIYTPTFWRWVMMVVRWLPEKWMARF